VPEPKAPGLETEEKEHPSSIQLSEAEKEIFKGF